MSLLAPVPITPEHDVSAFACGQATLDDWLRRRALPNQQSGASRTNVVTVGGAVIAYYALASGGLTLSEATGSFRRNMPEPVPVVILARLAVDRSYHGQELGRALFRDAAVRVIAAADVIGVRGLIVHALTDEAAAFYRSLGLALSSTTPRLMMATLAELRASL